MKILNAIASLVVVLFFLQGCEKEQSDFMKSIPKNMKILSHVTTYYYTDEVVTDTFYYNPGYEIICLERSASGNLSRFYFEGRRLKESTISVNRYGETEYFDIQYLADGKLSLSNNTNAYILSGEQSGYYTELVNYTRVPFGDWDETYQCNFSWEQGNLVSSCDERQIYQYAYDENPNPLAGYTVWGFFLDDLMTGTRNNRAGDGYQYEYDADGYPLRLVTPRYFREYHYH